MTTGVAEDHTVSIFRVEGFCLNLSLPCHEDHNTNFMSLVVSFLLGKSPASVYYCMPTFRNSLSVPSSKALP